MYAVFRIFSLISKHTVDSKLSRSDGIQYLFVFNIQRAAASLTDIAVGLSLQFLVAAQSSDQDLQTKFMSLADLASRTQITQ